MLTLPVEQFHVGIVCALHSELAAIEAMLDEQYENIKIQDAHDHNTYSVGRIHQHNVVIACLPAGVDGLAAAATVAKDMSRTFRQLRFGLLVGIGGGIPDPEREIDIRLGDVVVSEPSGTEGGVVQYDKGKSQPDGMWVRKGTLSAPPTVLLTALQKLKARHMRYDSQMPSLIADMLQRYPKMARIGYSYPGQSYDPQPGRGTNNPEIHYGIIASGNSVIKDATVRDRIRGECGALCVEMEAAGLMNDFPCLVIRGICDYADADKNDRWHRYAAATAAAYAKELLFYVSAEQTSQEKPVELVLGTLNKHFGQIHACHSRQEARLEQQEISYRKDKLRDCHRAFKTSNYEECKNRYPDRAPKTCQWLLQHSKYLKWLGNHRGDLLWVSADPGCGKSVLSRSLVDKDLHGNGDDTNTTICYFFFRDDEVQDGLATALSALLHQLFNSQPQLIRHALPKWERNGNNIAYDVNELWRILRKATTDQEAKCVVCVLDALDECRDSDRRRLISLLCNFYKDMAMVPQTCQLKFLVTSRPYEDIEHSFGRIITSLPSIRLRGENENDQIREEIDLVVRQRVQEIVTDFCLAPQTAKNLERKLISMEHRTYLWLDLAIDSIRRTFGHSLRPDQELIQLLPTSVDEAYEQMLSKVDKEQARNVRMILTIIIGVPRPLSIGEMAIALDIATAKTIPQLFPDLTITEDQLSARIRHWCGLFVFINHSRLYLIHQTAKEFLLRQPDFQRTSGNVWRYCLSATDIECEMARIYMLYLCLRDFEVEDMTNYSKSLSNLASDGISETNHKQTFFELAAESWPDLWRCVESSAEGDLRDKAWMLYDMQSPRFSRWTKLLLRAREPGERNMAMSGMVLAAYNGHIDVMLRILDNCPQDLEAKDSAGCTALIRGAARGHDDIVTVLLGRGANLNHQPHCHENAFLIACKNGHEKVAQLLIKAAAKTGVLRGNDVLALQFASQYGHAEVVRMLLDAGTDVNAHGEFYCNALALASKCGYGDIVQMLVDAGADVNTQRGTYGSALLAASAHGYDNIVEILVDAGADVNAREANLGGALYMASERGSGEMVQILIDAGAEVNVKDGYYWNSLYVASERGHTSVVQLLLEAGADVNAPGRNYDNALYAAAKNGHKNVVQILLDTGADVNARGGQCGNAFNAASRYGYGDIVQMLVDAGAHIENYKPQCDRISHTKPRDDTTFAKTMSNHSQKRKIVQPEDSASKDSRRVRGRQHNT